MGLQIYELADIAVLLDLEKSRVKNWTIGRPFSVRPSVRASSGKGSRNLFSRNDVYCFALVKRLNGIGVPVEAIQQMLQKMDARIGEDEFWSDGRDWLIIKRSGIDSAYQVDVDVVDDSFGYTNISFHSEADIVCSFGVRLKTIAEATSSKIRSFLESANAKLPKVPARRRKATNPERLNQYQNSAVSRVSDVRSSKPGRKRE